MQLNKKARHLIYGLSKDKYMTIFGD